MQIQTVTEPLIRHLALQTDSAEEIQNWHDDVLIGIVFDVDVGDVMKVSEKDPSELCGGNTICHGDVMRTNGKGRHRQL